jgi:hypothetical protein
MSLAQDFLKATIDGYEAQAANSLANAKWSREIADEDEAEAKTLQDKADALKTLLEEE